MSSIEFADNKPLTEDEIAEVPLGAWLGVRLKNATNLSPQAVSSGGPRVAVKTWYNEQKARSVYSATAFAEFYREPPPPPPPPPAINLRKAIREALRG